MHVTKDVNLGTLFPIVAFLIAQTGAIIWWAANMTAQLDLLSSDVAEFQVDLRTEVGDRVEDRRRIYDRIVANEKLIADIVANERATEAVLISVQEDLKQLRNEIAQNNELIRQFLVEMGRAANDGRP